MDSREFYDYVKHTATRYVSENGKDIRIYYSIREKPTDNYIMPFRYNGIHFGFQERQEDATLNTFKNYKITYTSKKAGNQLYFFSNMKNKFDNKIRQLVSTGKLKAANRV